MTDTTYQLPVMETLHTSWSKVYGSKGSFWAALLLVFVILFGLGLGDGLVLATAPTIEPVVNIFMQVFAFLLNMGIIYIGIRRAQDLPISYNMVFRALEGWLSFKVVGLYLLQIIIFIIPMILIMAGIFIYSIMHTSGAMVLTILLCITGVIITIYLAVRIMLSTGFVLDKEMGPWKALTLSFRATRSNIWRLIGIVLLQYLILLISILPLGIGLIWSIPFSFINYGVIYKNLTSNNLR